MTTLIEGRWYWVRRVDGVWFPALCSASAAGGWTNSDTWEDFASEIIEWRLIKELPPEDREALNG